MMMKKTLLIFLLLLPSFAFAQLIGIGTQYVPVKDGANALQFQMNLSAPIFPKNPLPLNTIWMSGVDYTGGSSPVAGLNIKPIQLRNFISDSFYNNHKVTLLLGFDAGYILNHRHGKNGIVLTPNVHLEYKFFYLNTGWDFNVTGHRNQFYVRLGVGFGLGSFKMFGKTKIR